MVYADTAGNIGFVVAGVPPIRKNWTGLLPVPGTGEFEWSGYLSADQMPSQYNPARHFLATANNFILQPGNKPISYEWGAPFRAQRIEEMLTQPGKFAVADFERMQKDAVSIPARRFQAVLRRWNPKLSGTTAASLDRIRQWDARLTADSVPGLIWELWFAKIPAALFGPELGARAEVEDTLKKLESLQNFTPLADTLNATVSELERYLGADMNRWQLSRITAMFSKHPLG